MKAKKILLTGVALSLSLSLVACNNKETTPKQNNNTTNNTTTTQDNATTMPTDYTSQYANFYDANLSNLGMYRMYETPEAATEYYKTNKYPGNKQYVEDLKEAYKDSRDKIQTFVNDLKNDAKTDDKEISDMNQQLIAEGEKTIKDIDARLKNLDNLPENIYDKGQDDFIKAVDEGVRVKDNTGSQFNNLLQKMNDMLGIDTGTNNNNTG
ncbi:MAG: hypothetical protein IJH55_01555, partial [Romboutsia sp.]|nr:hypothetical protein [Romboutsia sp.]